jgi:hypothetical protein
MHTQTDLETDRQTDRKLIRKIVRERKREREIIRENCHKIKISTVRKRRRYRVIELIVTNKFQ